MDTRSIFNPSKNGPNDLRSPISLSAKEPPACVQNAMMNREKKPFTYLPGGLDLSQIKSEKMARRLMINALSPGVQEKPRPPSFTPNPDTPPIKSSHYFNMPVAVFPCIQIPSNPKELLRRTSGPFNRSESIEKTKEIPDKKTNGFANDNETIKTIVEKAHREDIAIKEKLPVKETEEIPENTIKSYSPIIHDISEFKNDEKLQIELPLPNNEPPIVDSELQIDSPLQNNDPPKTYTPIIEEKPQIESPIPNTDPPKTYTPIIDENKIEDVVILPNSESITSICFSPIVNGVKIEENFQIESETKPQTPINEETFEDAVELLIPNCDSSTESSSPSIDDLIEDEPVAEICPSPIAEPIQTETTETCIDEVPESETIDSFNKNCDIILEEPIKCISPICNIESIINELNIEEDVMKREEIKIEEENRVISPMRRSTETIKGLTDDLDSLPSLNICTKRFSFLRDFESPINNEEDPYSIVTGIPPKISLIDKKVINEESVKPEPIESVPVIINSFIPKTEITAPSPLKNVEEEFWKKDLWNNDIPSKETVSIKDFLNDDPEPAWKKEIREIAMRKAEAKEESVEYNVDKEPPWKRELRELTQAREAKLLDTNEITLKDPIYESPWGMTNNTFYRPMNQSPNRSAFAQNPKWSQTLRPKTWKERNGEAMQKPKEVEVPDWKKTPSKHFMESFIKKQLSRSNSNSSDVANKTPEITVEVVNQPSYTSFPSTNSSTNGYVYPWESSSESSIAFSPEPRTPTPQSRNSPFTHNSNYSGYSQNSVAPREYGTLSFQPRRNPARSCPIQSRSFKYLQLLTGTDDSYDNDEPFIPQPAQHAYPKPGNF